MHPLTPLPPPPPLPPHGVYTPKHFYVVLLFPDGTVGRVGGLFSAVEAPSSRLPTKKVKPTTAAAAFGAPAMGPEVVNKKGKKSSGKRRTVVVFYNMI